MKISHTKLKSSFIISLSLISLGLWAKSVVRPVAQVTDISGQVFFISPEGETKLLKANDHVGEKSEIMVEEGGTITLNDYYDTSYHLIGGSHLKFFNKSVQLKAGKAWIQSQNSSGSLALTTANGYVDFTKAEFIATFDQTTSKSQILVVNGEVEVSNVLDRNIKAIVAAGTFTLVDPEIENGVPRNPTKVGLSSLDTALSEFKKLPAKEMGVTNSNRSIASITEEKVPALPVKKGEIIFISSNRLPASVSGQAHKYYKKSLTKKKSIKRTVVPIKFYGSDSNVRVPASVPPISRPQAIKIAPNTLRQDAEFEHSLKAQSIEQPKYSEELKNLILNLKSYE